MDHLFFEGDLDATLRATMEAALKDIDDWSQDQLVRQSETEIIDYVVNQRSVRCPVLDLDNWWMDEPEDGKARMDDPERERFYGHPIEYDVTRTTVHIPFDGEDVFFRLRPSSFSTNPPRAVIGKGEIILRYEDREFDPEAIRQRVNETIGKINTHLERSRAQADRHNAELPGAVEATLRMRKDRILANQNTARAVGIPIRRRDDAPPIPVPMQRKTIRTERPRPKTVNSPYEPEPMMDDAIFEAAVDVLRAGGVELERLPETTLALPEEGRRNLLLVALNSQFEGRAGGEMFNGSGKTDILLRVDGRNVFIAEIKIWHGTKAFTAAIDQLLGYTVWRDSKAVLILFIETKNGTAIIDKAAAAIAEHPRHRKTVAASRPDERRDFIFEGDADPARDIHLTFLPFVVRPPDTETLADD